MTEQKHIVHTEGDRFFGVFPSPQKAHQWVEDYFQDDPDYIVLTYDKVPRYVTNRLEKVDANGHLEL